MLLVPGRLKLEDHVLHLYPYSRKSTKHILLFMLHESRLRDQAKTMRYIDPPGNNKAPVENHVGLQDDELATKRLMRQASSLLK